MNIKRFERLFSKYLIFTSYQIFKIIPIQNKISFATYRTNELKDNFRYIYEKMNEEKLDYKYQFLLRKYDPSLKGKFFYLFHMIRATYHLATSKYFIIDDYYFPIYVIKPRPNTEIIQVWHACGAFKKFGYSVMDKGYGSSEEYISDIPIHSNYSSVIVSSNEVAQHYAEAFNMDKRKIFALGVPRTDIFFDKNLIEKTKEKVYSLYPKLKNKKIVLYAPTFRGTNQSDVRFDHTMDLNSVAESLSDEYIFAVKLHPFVKSNLSTNNPKLIDLSNYREINDLLLISDILITDYSSVIFEFSLMEKPIIMYAPDKEQYIKERDFYYDYDTFVPGPIVENDTDLITMLKEQKWDIDKVKNFKNRFFDYTDGNSSERFIDILIKKNYSKSKEPTKITT